MSGTLATESFGDGNGAPLGDGQSGSEHHALLLGQRLVEEVAQALRSRHPRAHGPDVGATLIGGLELGVLAGWQACRHLQDFARRCRRRVRRHRHLGGHQHEQAQRSEPLLLQLHGAH